MKAILAALLLLAASGTQPASEPGVSYYSRGHGKHYAVVVTEAALRKAPAWKDADEHPPLGPRAAMRAADRVRERVAPDTDDWVWEREAAALREFGGRWYWLVTYDTKPRNVVGIGGPTSQLRLAVLMDGTVVEPVCSRDRRLSQVSRGAARPAPQAGRTRRCSRPPAHWRFLLVRAARS